MPQTIERGAITRISETDLLVIGVRRWSRVSKFVLGSDARDILVRYILVRADCAVPAVESASWP